MEILQFRFVYVYMITTNAPAAAPRLMAASRDRSNGTLPTSKHRRDDQDQSKFRKYENLCLQDQAKRLKKHVFAATNDVTIDGIAQFFFLLSLAMAFVLHSKNNVSTTEKPRYTYIL